MINKVEVKKRKAFYVEDSILSKIEEIKESQPGISYTDIVEYALISLSDDTILQKDGRTFKSYWLSPEVIQKIEKISKKNNVNFYDVFKESINVLYKTLNK